MPAAALSNVHRAALYAATDVAADVQQFAEYHIVGIDHVARLVVVVLLLVQVDIHNVERGE